MSVFDHTPWDIETQKVVRLEHAFTPHKMHPFALTSAVKKIIHSKVKNIPEWTFPLFKYMAFGIQHPNTFYHKHLSNPIPFKNSDVPSFGWSRSYYKPKCIPEQLSPVSRTAKDRHTRTFLQGDRKYSRPFCSYV